MIHQVARQMAVCLVFEHQDQETIQGLAGCLVHKGTCSSLMSLSLICRIYRWSEKTGTHKLHSDLYTCDVMHVLMCARVCACAWHAYEVNKNVTKVKIPKIDYSDDVSVQK